MVDRLCVDRIYVCGKECGVCLWSVLIGCMWKGMVCNKECVWSIGRVCVCGERGCVSIKGGWAYN